jgi:hypothetical protein
MLWLVEKRIEEREKEGRIGSRKGGEEYTGFRGSQPLP